jgi:hypothetical protein
MQILAAKLRRGEMWKTPQDIEAVVRFAAELKVASIWTTTHDLALLPAAFIAVSLMRPEPQGTIGEWPL